MIQTLQLLLRQLAVCLRSRAELELENLVLRHQIEILRRSAPKRARLVKADRFVFTLLLRLWPKIAHSIRIVHPKTLVRWHREGFRTYWRWKSRSRGGRPKATAELRPLIRKMCSENPLWGAPRIHGELRMLGFEISQSTVSKYMSRRPTDPDQCWKTFIHNHVDCTASIDFLVVPTITFKVLFVLIVLSHERRRAVHFGITTNPTAEWTARQITEAFPWDTAPRFLIRDRHRTYGQVFRNRLAMMAITDVVTAPRSPWQNGYVERLIGSVRRECFDHIIAVSDRQLRRVLKSYLAYYNQTRTHLALDKDAPEPRSPANTNDGPIVAIPEVGGLHHRYERVVA
jgi:transposase InsO family protein